MLISPKFRIGCAVALLTLVPHGFADERRARAPKFSDQEMEGVFFDDLTTVFQGARPSLSALRQSAQAAAVAAANPATSGNSGSGGSDDKWAKLISSASIEDEIKRLKLHFDSVVTTPGAFNSGGYQDARLDLTVLAMLFGVITEYGGEVRWKDQAAAARDLLARTAFNCKAGSTQVYNEAKLRKADLQDLVSGSGLSQRDAEPENDWAMIADRSPLMEYGEFTIETLEDLATDVGKVESNASEIRRGAQLIAVFGEVLTKEGLDQSDDEDYVIFSREMIEAANNTSAALERSDFEEARLGVSNIRQKCDACHEQYR